MLWNSWWKTLLEGIDQWCCEPSPASAAGRFTKDGFCFWRSFARLIPLLLGEAGEKGAKSQPTNADGKEEHCRNVAHHSIGTTDTREAQTVYIKGEDLHEGEEAAQVHWQSHLNT